MVLIFDIGNAEIDIGIFDISGQLMHHLTLPTEKKKTSRSYTLSLKTLLLKNNINLPDIKSIAIGSVVDSVTNKLVDASYDLFKIYPYIIRHNDLEKVIAIKYEPKESVGIDRIANAVAGLSLFQPPLIVVDLGSAITVNVVSAEGEFIGGAITIGLGTAIESLHKNIPALPKIELYKEKLTNVRLPVIGGSTESCLVSGFYYGFLDLIDGLISRTISELAYPGEVSVLATGGLSNLIAHATKTIKYIDPALTLKGYYLIYQKLTSVDTA